MAHFMNFLKSMNDSVQRLKSLLAAGIYHCIQGSEIVNTFANLSLISLFHVVVDNDETATRLMEAMATEKAGRVTFMPLNRLRTRPTVYPSGADAIPMMSKLTFDPMFQKALEQVSHTYLNGMNCHHRKAHLNGFLQ